MLFPAHIQDKIHNYTMSSSNLIAGCFPHFISSFSPPLCLSVSIGLSLSLSLVHCAKDTLAISHTLTLFLPQGLCTCHFFFLPFLFPQITVQLALTSFRFLIKYHFIIKGLPYSSSTKIYPFYPLTLFSS